MAGRIIHFPQRNAFRTPHTPDALARDTQRHASRIALQVEEELARKAARMAIGDRIQLAEARGNMVRMPRLARWAQFRAMVFAIRSRLSFRRSR